MPSHPRDPERSPSLRLPPPTVFTAGVVALGLALVLLAVGAALNQGNARHLFADQRAVSHSYRVLGELEALLSTIKDAETGQRGYLLTGDGRYLEPYREALGEVEGRIADLGRLTADSPIQQAHLAELQPRVAAKLAELARTLQLAERGDRAAALGVVRSGVGRAQMMALQKTVAAMQREEQSLLERRAAESAQSYRTALSSILLIAVAGSALVGLAALLLYRNRRQERRAERQREELLRSTATANLRLRQAEEQFHTLADSIPQLAWMTDPQGKVLWFNRRWYDYTGARPEALDRRDREALLAPAERARIQEKFEAHVATGEPWEDTFPLRRHDGVFRWHLSRAVPVRDDEGKIVHWFGTNTDVTDRLELEEGLRKLAADLSEADRRKDEFLATLSHELRNPLAPLWTGLQVLKLLGHDSADAHEARAMMERQLQQMVRLVDDLLDVSRITRNKLELRKERVALATVFDHSIETSRGQIEAHGVTLTVTLPAEPVALDADVTRLAQVFANLLNNAAKYTERGGDIRLAATAGEGQVTVSVKDSGIGIPPEMLPQVFDMFTQIDRTLERAQGGLGIGLTLVKRLVELHGGSVEAKSEGRGRGTELIVRLPTASGEPALAAPAGSGSAAALPPCRILVVDDKEDAVESLRVVLEHSGHEVAFAHDGLEAVAQAASFHPDIILLDIGLPKLNGYEACRRIRQLPGRERTLIVALTGWGQDEDRRRSREAGFSFHLVKPLDPNELEATLAGFLAAADEGDPGPPGPGLSGVSLPG